MTNKEFKDLKEKSNKEFLEEEKKRENKTVKLSYNTQKALSKYLNDSNLLLG